ncbi:MAG: hypothetical protein Q3M24_18585 [Candidatus Electrothrix aestuarii]|uniref:Uncharacterized protein n=1 Tax=Candidatus Electrothrix aestuarii TaxID=3062594 RepID=A0AAU8LSW7_9BACT
MIPFSYDIGHPYDGGPSPAELSLISMLRNMPVDDFPKAHPDHLCYKQRDIIHSLCDDLKFVFVENALLL